MELRLGPRPRSPRLLALGGGGGGGPDLLSALPDDLLLLVLARLPCAGAAARTAVLSRRWRGLWARLRRIALRDVPFDSLEPALARVLRPPPTVTLLEIRLPEPPRLVDTGRLNSLLRAAALLDPEEFLLVFPLDHYRDVLHLPSFRLATSIELDLYSPVHSYNHYATIRCLPEGVEFPALETLSMSHCLVYDSDALLSRCPRLRTLRLHVVEFNRNAMSVVSPSLEELVVVTTWIRSVNVVAPVLKQSAISLNTYQEHRVSISIQAPMVEKLSWACYFSKESGLFGLWWLMRLSLRTAEGQVQPPSLQIHACIESPPIYYHQGAFTQGLPPSLFWS